MPIIKIDDKEYDVDSLPGQARKQLQMLQYVDAELARLKTQSSVLQTARTVHGNALKQAVNVAAILQIKSRLRAMESMPIEAQRKVQETQLRALFRHASQYSDWWRTRLTKAGYIQDEANTTCTAFSVLENVPLLLRGELQEHFEALRARPSTWSEKDIFTSTTSGSTGLPVRVEKFMPWYNPTYSAVGVIDHEWHGRDARLRLASFSNSATEDSSLPNWGPEFAASQGSGPAMIRGIMRRTPAQHCAWLLKHRPAYLKITASLAAAIGESLIAQGKTLPLRQIFTQSSRVTQRERSICRQAFEGAEIKDRYSCEETGWLALQCPKHEHFHVMAGTTILEIVDDNLKPCPVGVAGRVLVTNLYSYAMPMIRYDVGDIAQWGDECDCGIKLPVISRLWGRRRNMVRLPDGQLHPMVFFGDDVAELPKVKEFRLIQKNNGDIDFLIRADGPLTEEEVSKLRSYVSKFEPDLVVNICEVSVIDWGPGWKREEFVRLEM